LLKRTIESLIHQSYPKASFEIIVVDNSSTDGTGEMVQSLQEKTSHNLRYYSKENEGPGSSRNFGIAKAGGTIVAFTDSDCIADHDWLKNGVAKMTDGVGIVQGKTLPDSDQPHRTLQQTMKVVSEDSYYQTCNIFYRKERLVSAGGFSPEFCGLNFFGKPRWGGEDTDLAWRVKKEGWKSVFADDSVVYHHVFPVNSLRDFIQSVHLTIIFTLARIFKKHPEIRSTILYRRIFKSKQRALFYLFMLSLISGMFVHWGFYLFGLPYLTRLLRVSFQRRPLRAYHRGIALLCIIVFIELIESVLSLSASLVHRTVIL
jgi:glycosyltransferase involved in cell wall biosynthesis